MPDNIEQLKNNSTSELIKMYENISQFITFLEKEEKNIKED